ncbi:hypothetical protein [Streptomyces sp. NPDC051561]|uniref:hypothetical protein n=1 Tax=Streptomyces sp. NPDC051561 TaxID=3365658 RepID=UPI0037A07E59
MRAHTHKRAVALTTAVLSVGGLFAVGPASGAAAAPAQARTVQSAGATSAQAGSEVATTGVNAQARCNWPRVCFYRYGTLKAAYKDKGFQYLGARGRSSNRIVNTRRDDGARIYVQRYNGSGKHWECARPGRSYGLKAGWMPYAINIRNSPTCR